MKEIATFLMFSGKHHGEAKAAMELYVSTFPSSVVERIECYGPGETEPEGTVRGATFLLNGRRFMAMDSAAPHNFNFTPSISIFVECETSHEIEHFYATLVQSGEALMPLADYGFSERFGWVNDRFGVSWQLNLPHGVGGYRPLPGQG